MGDVARADWRTVLFVSHNMAAIESLCSRCLHMNGGRIVFDGSTHEAIAHYLQNGPQAAQSEVGTFVVRAADNVEEPFPVTRLRIVDTEDHPVDSLRMGMPFRVLVDVEGLDVRGGAQVGLEIRNEINDLIGGVGTHQKSPDWPAPHEQREQLVFDFAPLAIVPGSYTIDVGVWDPDARTSRTVEMAAQFTVIASDVYGSGYARWHGVIYPEFDWTIRPAERVEPDHARDAHAPFIKWREP
jgi:lipopolysaccharide transport system ATP-binding protein